MSILFGANILKTIPEETWTKLYLGQDPDPDVFKSRILIRNTGFLSLLLSNFSQISFLLCLL
jgi:hypothetical protein